MTCYKFPREIRGIIFDMDSTLYTSEEYNRFQYEAPVKKLALLKGLSFDDMDAQIEAYQDEWAGTHEGKRTSMGNVFAAFGIPIKESVLWREELLDPSRFLSEDPRLQKTLKILVQNFSVSIVTNNPVSVARKTLAVLGVEQFFGHIIGLDTTGISKPHPEPFLKAAREMNLSPEQCISVGDRYDIDLAIPLSLGMGGVLVKGAEDVYELPRVLGIGE